MLSEVEKCVPPLKVGHSDTIQITTMGSKHKEREALPSAHIRAHVCFFAYMTPLCFRSLAQIEENERAIKRSREALFVAVFVNKKSPL